MNSTGLLIGLLLGLLIEYVGIPLFGFLAVWQAVSLSRAGWMLFRRPTAWWIRLIGGVGVVAAWVCIGGWIGYGAIFFDFVKEANPFPFVVAYIVSGVVAVLCGRLARTGWSVERRLARRY